MSSIRSLNNWRMKHLFFILLTLLNLHDLSAALDGAWNGKPFSKEVLQKGVDAGKPAALAEWAFCSLSSQAEIPYDRELIQKRAEKAAKAGNALGHYVIAEYQGHLEGNRKDIKKMVTALKKARKGKHPLALWKEGVFLRRGIYGYPKDHKKGMAQIEAAAEMNCIYAFSSLSIVYRTGELGEVDLEEAASFFKKGLAFKSPDAAEDICRARIKESKYRGMSSYFSEEEYLEAEQVLKQVADRGHPHYSYYYGHLLIRLNRPHEAIPYVIYASKYLSYPSHALLQRIRSRAAGDLYINCIASDYLTEWKQAEKVYELGKANSTTKRLVATSYLAMVKNKHPKEKEGVKILEELIRNSPEGDCQASHALARFLTEKYLFREEKNLADFDRGITHLLLHSRCEMGSHWLGSFYEYNDPTTRDIPKALAALHHALKINTGAWKRREEQLQKKLLKEASPEELQKAEDLIADQWPYHKKHREKAFLKLQKIGDIPQGAKFDPKFRFPDARGDL